MDLLVIVASLVAVGCGTEGGTDSSGLLDGFQVPGDSSTADNHGQDVMLDTQHGDTETSDVVATPGSTEITDGDSSSTEDAGAAETAASETGPSEELPSQDDAELSIEVCALQPGSEADQPHCPVDLHFDLGTVPPGDGVDVVMLISHRGGGQALVEHPQVDAPFEWRGAALRSIGQIETTRITNWPVALTPGESIELSLHLSAGIAPGSLAGILRLQISSEGADRSLAALLTLDVMNCAPQRDNCNGDWTDGCEVHLAADGEHCGVCFNVCGEGNADEVCRNGVCSQNACAAGTWGPSCQPCPASELGTCSGRGDCDDGEGGTGRCTCDAGWTGADCSFADHCTLGSHECAAEARCVNDGGNHLCLCEPGWSGDGRRCTACIEGSTFTAAADQTECLPCTTCGEGTYQVTACATTADRRCGPCRDTCATCTSPGSLGCTSCGGGRILVGSRCALPNEVECLTAEDCPDACVAGACSSRSDARGLCDPDDDGDCTPGNRCVEGGPILLTVPRASSTSPSLPRVSLHGDRALLVSSRVDFSGDYGAEVYRRRGPGLWQSEAILRHPTSQYTVKGIRSIQLSEDAAFIASRQALSEQVNRVRDVVDIYSPVAGAGWAHRQTFELERPHPDFPLERSMAYDAGFLIVAAVPGDDPSVRRPLIHVFARNDDGSWAPQEDIKTFERIADGSGEHKLALKGDLLVIGDPTGSHEGARSGRLLVASLRDSIADASFLRGDLGPPAPQEDERFGEAIAVSDNAIIVGSPAWTNVNGDPVGRVTVFRKQRDGSWGISQVLRAPDGSFDFGRQLAAAGHRLIVDSWTQTNVDTPPRHLVFLFSGLESGPVSEVAPLQMVFPNSQGEVGHYFAISDDVALVSAERGVELLVDQGPFGNPFHTFRRQEAGSLAFEFDLSGEPTTPAKHYRCLGLPGSACTHNAECIDICFQGACDVDECETELDDCAENALCTNRREGFDCACSKGYVGDGRSCTPCEEGQTHADAEGSEICRPCTVCPRGTYELRSCRPWSNTVCSPCPDDCVQCDESNPQICLVCEDGFRPFGGRCYRSCIRNGECDEACIYGLCLPRSGLREECDYFQDEDCDEGLQCSDERGLAFSSDNGIVEMPRPRAVTSLAPPFLYLGNPGRRSGLAQDGSVEVFSNDHRPGWHWQATLEGEGSRFNGFGAAIASEGRSVLIGAPDHPGESSLGRAYFLEFQGNMGDVRAGSWTLSKVLSPQTGRWGRHHGDRFGIEVALSGAVAVVGGEESRYSFSEVPDFRIAIYRRHDDGGDWSWEAEFGAREVDATRVFPTVAVDETGERLALRAEGDVGGGLRSFISIIEFVQGEGWRKTRTVNLTGELSRNGGAGAVELSGERLFVASTDPVASSAVGGILEVFERGTEGEWTLRQVIRHPELADDESFGADFAVAGSWMLVGAPLSGMGEPAQGMVYVFFADAEDGWEYQYPINPPGYVGDSGFGSAVEMADHTEAVIGGSRVSPWSGSRPVVYPFFSQIWSWNHSHAFPRCRGAEGQACQSDDDCMGVCVWGYCQD